MTAQLPGPDAPLDDLADWREEAIEEVWEMTDFEIDSAPSPANSLRITDLQHWLDLCA